MASQERELNIELYISTATRPLEYFLSLFGDVTNREVWMGPTRIDTPCGYAIFVSADDIKIPAFLQLFRLFCKENKIASAILLR